MSAGLKGGLCASNLTERSTTLGGGIGFGFWPAMGRSAPVLPCLARRSCRAFYPEFAPGGVIFSAQRRGSARGVTCAQKDGRQ